MASELEWPISNNLMACASSLPLELIDFSIDFLHADMQSLSACSLVCRSWVPATRFHLFGSVEIHQSLQAAASRRHCRNPANTLSFIKLLESRDNTISPYIRSAMLDMTGVDIPDKLISALCNARVNITKLDITTYRQSLTFLLRIPQVFSGITNLEIKVSQALYHNTEDYARIHEGLLFAMSFPALHTLCFDASFELDTEVPPSTCAKLDVSHNIIFHHLHTLTLRVQDSETVIEWLRSSGWQPHLRKLSVHIYHPWHGKGRPMAHLNALLEDNSETLEDFTVIVDGGDGEDLPLKSMDHGTLPLPGPFNSADFACTVILGPGFEQLNFSSLFKLHSLHLRMYFLKRRMRRS